MIAPRTVPVRGRASSGDISCVVGFDSDVTGDGVGEGSAYFKYATYSAAAIASLICARFSSSRSSCVCISSRSIVSTLRRYSRSSSGCVEPIPATARSTFSGFNCSSSSSRRICASVFVVFFFFFFSILIFFFFFFFFLFLRFFFFVSRQKKKKKKKKKKKL